jgi:hypothetical protein
MLLKNILFQGILRMLRTTNGNCLSGKELANFYLANPASWHDRQPHRRVIPAQIKP